MSADAPTTTSPAAAPALDGAGSAALVRARRTWRRAGVRRADRAALAEEIAGEVLAAAADGYGPDSVLGEDVAVTARALALERGLAGRSLQVATMLWVVLAGVLLGSSTVIMTLLMPYLSDALDLGRSDVDGPVAVTISITSCAMAVLLPVLGTWAALHHRGDPRAGATARWLAAVLPVAGMAGALLAVVAAAPLEYSWLDPAPFAAAIFLAWCAGAGLVARHLAVRFAPIPR